MFFFSTEDLKTYFFIYAKALGVFSGTFLILFVLWSGISGTVRYFIKRSAINSIPEKTVRMLDMAEEPSDYEPTVQTWFVPHYAKWLKPISWLKFTENCIVCVKLNAMKFAGMIPGDWDIKDFMKHTELKNACARWGLCRSSTGLSPHILDEINAIVNKNSKFTYRWRSIRSMDELIYLAKRDHHVMIYSTVWLGPSKGHPRPRRWRGFNFSHATTIAGIKSYDQDTGIVEFEVNETLPFSSIIRIPVFNKFNKDGYTIFNRQSQPYIIRHGDIARCGYLVRVLKEKAGAVKRKLKKGKRRKRLK